MRARIIYITGFLIALFFVLFSPPSLHAENMPEDEHVDFRDQYVFGMYMNGVVTDWARGLGMNDWDYVKMVLDDMKALGVNVVHPNNMIFETLPTWIELAKERGMRLIAQGGGGPPMLEYYLWNPADHEHFGYKSLTEARQAFKNEMLPNYRKLAEKYQNDPTLLAFCLTEEIAIDEPWIFEDLRTVIEEYRKIDPYHAAYVEYHWADMAVKGLQTTKPSLVAYGAGTVDKEPWHDNLDWFEVWTEQVGKEARAQGAVFYAVLTSALGHKRENNAWVVAYEPTAEDIGLQVWLAYANGANGVDFWWYHDYTERQDDGTLMRFLGVRDLEGKKTRMWDAIVRAAKQAAPLAPWLPHLRVVEGNGGIPYAREGNWVRARLMEIPETKEKFLLIVNKDTKKKRAFDLDISSLLPEGKLPARLPELKFVEPSSLIIPPGEGILLQLTSP